MESADRDAKTLMHTTSTPVHIILGQTLWQQQQARRSPFKGDQTCYQCKRKHSAKSCHFKYAKCRNCRKKGNIARPCISMPCPPQWAQVNRQQTHLLTDVKNNFSDTDPAYSLFNVTHTSIKPLLVTVELNESPVDMEVDTGASMSLISKITYDKLWPNLTTTPPLQKSDILFQTSTGEHLDVVGSVFVDVTYKEYIAHLPLTVVAGRGPSLLGWDWLQHIKLDWKAWYLVGIPPH